MKQRKRISGREAVIALESGRTVFCACDGAWAEYQMRPKSTPFGMITLCARDVPNGAWWPVTLAPDWQWQGAEIEIDSEEKTS
jgi:hypothetical protein